MVSAISTLPTLAPNRLIAALGGLRVDRPAGPQPTELVQPGRSIEEAPTGKTELTNEERAQVEKLQQRDAEVRRHESAHKAAAGSHASGGPTFTYEAGPDGKRYAVGGEVAIDTSPVEGDPKATVQKMRQIRAAALAPSEPSSQDRQVAAQAASAEQEASAELRGRSETAGTDRADAESSFAGAASVAATYGRTLGSAPREQAGRFIDAVA